MFRYAGGLLKKVASMEGGLGETIWVMAEVAKANQGKGGYLIRDHLSRAMFWVAWYVQVGHGCYCNMTDGLVLSHHFPFCCHWICTTVHHHCHPVVVVVPRLPALASPLRRLALGRCVWDGTARGVVSEMALREASEMAFREVTRQIPNKSLPHSLNQILGNPCLNNPFY